MAKVLILHNSKKKLRELHHALVKEGFDVIFSTSGADGEKLYFEENPDCVVADILLSGKQGGDISIAIKNTPEGSKTPVILTTALFRNMSEMEAKRKWAVDRFFTEPYSTQEIVTATKDLIKKYLNRNLASDTRKTAKPSTTQAALINPEREIPAAKPRPQTQKAGSQKPHETVAPFEKPVTKRQSEAPTYNLMNEALAEMAQEAAETFDLLGYEVKSTPKPKAAPSFNESIKTETIPEEFAAAEPEEEDIFCELEGPPGIAEEVMDLEGDLEDTSIPELFAVIYLNKLDGQLEVNNGQANKIVYFRAGIPIYASGEARDETLGQILVKYRIISQEAAFISLQSMSAFGKKQGGALLEMGALTPMQLYQALKLQVREKLLSLFAWFEGTYFFDPGKVDTSQLTIFEIQPPRLIFEGVKRHLAQEMLCSIFEETKDFRIRLTGTAELRDKFKLPDECASIIKFIDGKKLIWEIVTRSKLNRITACQVMYTLLLLGVFERVPEDETVERRWQTRKAKIADIDYEFESIASDFIDSIIEDDEFISPDDIIPYRDEGIEAAEMNAEIIPDPSESEVDIEPEPDIEPIEKEIPAGPPPRPERSKSSIIDLRDALANKDESDVMEIGDLDAAFKQLESKMEVRKNQRITGDYSEDQNTEPTPPAPTDDDGVSDEDKKLRDRILTDFLALETSNHYQILHLESDVTEQQIKAKYRELVKTLHEDILGQRFGKQIIEKANAIMVQVTEAYNTLSDSTRRRDYDRRLSRGDTEARERYISNILVAEQEFSLGMAAQQRHDFSSAKEHFQNAVKGFPEESVYHTHLGWATYKTPGGKQSDKAVQATSHLEKAIKINPKTDKPYYYLGVILKENGYKDKAARMFAMAFRYNRKNALAKEELRRLQQEKARIKASAGGAKAQNGKDEKGIFSKELDLKSVKNAFLKMFK